MIRIQWKMMFNAIAWITGLVIIFVTADNLWQMGVIAVGLLISCLRLNITPEIRDRAINELTEITIQMYGLCREIARNWVPVDSSESMAKEVILAEMRDLVPPKVWDQLQSEENAK